MKTIWKYKIDVTDRQMIEMPCGAELLSVGVQDGHPVLWALVNPTHYQPYRVLRIYGTGHPVDDEPKRFVGTFMLHDGALVFHVFEEIETREVA